MTDTFPDPSEIPLPPDTDLILQDEHSDTDQCFPLTALSSFVLSLGWQL